MSNRSNKQILARLANFDLRYPDGYNPPSLVVTTDVRIPDFLADALPELVDAYARLTQYAAYDFNSRKSPDCGHTADYLWALDYIEEVECDCDTKEKAGKALFLLLGLVTGVVLGAGAAKSFLFGYDAEALILDAGVRYIKASAMATRPAIANLPRPATVIEIGGIEIVTPNPYITDNEWTNEAFGASRVWEIYYQLNTQRTLNRVAIDAIAGATCYWQPIRDNVDFLPGQVIIQLP